MEFVAYFTRIAKLANVILRQYIVISLTDRQVIITTTEPSKNNAVFDIEYRQITFTFQFTFKYPIIIIVKMIPNSVIQPIHLKRYHSAHSLHCINKMYWKW